jgi:glycerol-3-phosphate acyltransferase PlsX
MGHVYAARVLGVEAPRIGLLSNGEEEGKGSQLVREAFPLLSVSGLRFIGNVESNDLVRGVADVAVTDGFTGNVVIKTAEGTASLITESIRAAARSDWRGKLGGLLLKPALRRAFAGLDYTEVGGAPLLGVAGVVVVGHGRSNARAITNLVRAGADAARGNVVAAIGSGLREFDLLKDQTA